MAKATNKSNQNDISEELNTKYARLITIQNELKVIFDYKWIKVVGVLMPYDIDKMQEKCEALRKEYDEIRKELAPYYPELQKEEE